MDLIQFHSFIELWISLSLIRCDRFPCSLGLGFIGFYSSLPISNYFNRFDFIIRALDGFHVYWQFFRIVWGFTDQRSFLYFFFARAEPRMRTRRRETICLGMEPRRSTVFHRGNVIDRTTVPVHYSVVGRPFQN